MFGFRKKLDAKVRSPLDTVESSGDIGTVRRSLPILMSSQGLRMGLYLGTNAILPFLMPPSEFGRIFQMQVPMTLCTLFGDFGISTGLVRVRTLTHELASLLFWLAIGVAVVSMSIMIAAVPLFESWYRTDGLGALGIAFGLLIVVRAAGATYRALLRRQLRLKALSTFELVSGIFTNGSTLIFALAGFGAISIPVGLAVGGTAELIGLVVLSGWLPGRAAPLREARSVVRFGVGLSLSGLVLHGGTALSQALMGRYFGESSLGLIERANALVGGVMTRVKQVLQGVLYPMLARRFSDRGSVQDLAAPLLGAAFRIWLPLVGFTVVATGPIFHAVYGGAYEGIAALATWGVVSFVLFLPSFVLRQALVAHGRTRYMVGLMMLQATLQIVATVLAIHLESIVVFAAATAATQFVVTTINVVCVPRLIGWTEVGSGRDLSSGLLQSVPAIATFSVLQWLGTPLPLGVGLAAVVLGAMLVMYLSGRGGTEIRRLLSS